MAQTLSPHAVRMSARVIALPTAAPHPVQQQRGPGRRAPHIINMSRWQLDRRFADKALPVDPCANLQTAHAFLQTCERLLQEARSQYLVAQQSAAVQRASRNVRPSFNLLRSI